MNRIIDLETGRYRLISIGRRTDHAGMTKLPLTYRVFSSYQHLMSLGFPPPRWPCKRRPRCCRLTRSAIRSPAVNLETEPSGAALSGPRVPLSLLR